MGSVTRRAPSLKQWLQGTASASQHFSLGLLYGLFVGRTQSDVLQLLLRLNSEHGSGLSSKSGTDSSSGESSLKCQRQPSTRRTRPTNEPGELTPPLGANTTPPRSRGSTTSENGSSSS